MLQLSKYFPPVEGGIETVAWELAEGLSCAGIDADVLCSAQERRTSSQRMGGKYEVRRAGSFGTLLSTSVTPSLAWHLRSMAINRDIVHVHMPDPAAALALWMVRPKAALVLHWHSDVVRQRIALRLYQPLQDWMLRQASCVIATSAPYAESSPALQAWRHKVSVIPIGISDNASCTDATKVAAIRQSVRGRRIVLALGRMTYYKGFDVLIEASAHLPGDTVVLIGGDGELLGDFKAQAARAGLAGRVHFLGHVPDADLPSYFAACDVFCLPSTVRAEAYGVAMLEAMMMGRPVVATNIAGSGVPWVNVHGETGLNVPVRDPRGLAEALNALLGDDARRRNLGEAARRRFLQFFTARHMTQLTLSLYRSLAPAA